MVSCFLRCMSQEIKKLHFPTVSSWDEITLIPAFIYFKMFFPAAEPDEKQKEDDKALLFKILPQNLQKLLGRFRKHLIFFPDNTQFVFKPGYERTKAEAAVSGCIDDTVQSNGISQALLNQ